MALVRQGHLDKAIATFQKELDHNSQNAVLLDAIGAAYSLEGDFEQAQKYFLGVCLRIQNLYSSTTRCGVQFGK
jgi:tetratricopeptide (TPR) repeat protein